MFGEKFVAEREKNGGNVIGDPKIAVNKGF